jgi:hypothetical protein
MVGTRNSVRKSPPADPPHAATGSRKRTGSQSATSTRSKRAKKTIQDDPDEPEPEPAAAEPEEDAEAEAEGGEDEGAATGHETRYVPRSSFSFHFHFSSFVVPAVVVNDGWIYLFYIHFF